MASTNDIVVINFDTRRIVALSASVGQSVDNLKNLKVLADKEHSGILNSDFVDIKAFKEEAFSAIKQAQIQYKNNFDKIYVGVPGAFIKVVVKKVSKKFNKSTKIVQQDIFDFEESVMNSRDIPNYTIISISPTYYLLDKKMVKSVVGKTGQEMQITYSCILCHNKFIDAVNEVFKSFFIKEDKIEFISHEFAECVSMFAPETRDNIIIICNIDELAINLAIGRGDGLLTYSTKPNGCSFIVKEVYEKLQLPRYADAEKMVLTLDVSSNSEIYEPYNVMYKGKSYPVPYKMVKEIILEKLNEIADEINKLISECKYDIPPHLPVVIFLNTLSNIKGSDVYLNKLINRNIQNQRFLEYGKLKQNYIPALCIMKLVGRKQNVNTKISLFEKIKMKLKFKNN